MTKISIATSLPQSCAALFQAPLQDRLLVTPVQAGEYLGWKKQTVYNKLNQERFPVPTVIVDGRRMVRVADLIEFVSKLSVLISNSQAKPSKVGRPTKADAISRRSEMSGGVK